MALISQWQWGWTPRKFLFQIAFADEEIWIRGSLVGGADSQARLESADAAVGLANVRRIRLGLQLRFKHGDARADGVIGGECGVGCHAGLGHAIYFHAKTRRRKEKSNGTSK